MPNNYSLVTFVDIPDDYFKVRDHTGNDVIECSYVITGGLAATSKDWVGLYSVGWRSVQECHSKVPVVLPRGYKSGAESSNKVISHLSVRHILEHTSTDKSDSSYYQFCYVSWDGFLRSMSTPFRIQTTPPSDDWQEYLYSSWLDVENVAADLKKQVQDMIIDILIQQQQEQLMTKLSENHENNEFFDNIGGDKSADQTHPAATFDQAYHLLKQLYTSSTMFVMDEPSRFRIRIVMNLLNSIKQRGASLEHWEVPQWNNDELTRRGILCNEVGIPRNGMFLDSSKQPQQQIEQLTAALRQSRAETERYRHDLDLLNQEFNEFKLQSESVMRSARPASCHKVKEREVFGKKPLGHHEYYSEVTRPKGELIDISLPFFYGTNLRNSSNDQWDSNSITDFSNGNDDAMRLSGGNESSSDVSVTYMCVDDARKIEELQLRDQNEPPPLPPRTMSKGQPSGPKTLPKPRLARKDLTADASKEVHTFAAPIANITTATSVPVDRQQIGNKCATADRGWKATNQDELKKKYGTMELYFRDVDSKMKTAAVKISNSCSSSKGGSRCPMCEKRFSGKASVTEMHEHIRMHYKTGRICPVCRKLFTTGTSQQEYQQHVSSHLTAKST